MNTKKMLEGVGWTIIGFVSAARVATAVAFPPLGLATFAKKMDDKVLAAASGVFVSALLTSGIGFVKEAIYNNQDFNNISESPKVTEEFDRSHWSNALLYVTSPIGYFTLPPEETRLFEKDSRKYFVEGDDVIVFDNNKQKYILNFGQNKEFGLFVEDKKELLINEILFGNDRRVKYNSIVDATNEYVTNVSDLEMQIKNSKLKNNPLMSLSDIQNKIDIEKEEYEGTVVAYERVREAFINAVNEMNSQFNAIEDSLYQEVQTK